MANGDVMRAPRAAAGGRRGSSGSGGGQGGGEVEAQPVPPNPAGVPPSLWTAGRAQSPPRAPFDPGDGLDIYIDGLLNLPDCAAAPRVEATVVLASGARVPVTGSGGLDFARAAPRPSADSLSPRLQLRLELREAALHPSATLALAIVGLDVRTGAPALIGRAAFALFAQLGAGAEDVAQATAAGEAREQPAEAASLRRPFGARLGAFQLRLYSERGARAPPPPDGADGTTAPASALLRGLRPLPAASVLVRVLRTPQTADGLGLLSAEDVPAEQHEALGLRVRAPEYASGAYDGAALAPTAAELTLLRARARKRGAGAEAVRDRLRVRALLLLVRLRGLHPPCAARRSRRATLPLPARSPPRSAPACVLARVPPPPAMQGRGQNGSAALQSAAPAQRRGPTKSVAAPLPHLTSASTPPSPRARHRAPLPRAGRVASGRRPSTAG